MAAAGGHGGARPAVARRPVDLDAAPPPPEAMTIAGIIFTVACAHSAYNMTAKCKIAPLNPCQPTGESRWSNVQIAATRRFPVGEPRRYVRTAESMCETAAFRGLYALRYPLHALPSQWGDGIPKHTARPSRWPCLPPAPPDSSCSMRFRDLRFLGFLHGKAVPVRTAKAEVPLTARAGAQVLRRDTDGTVVAIE